MNDKSPKPERTLRLLKRFEEIHSAVSTIELALEKLEEEDGSVEYYEELETLRTKFLEELTVGLLASVRRLRLITKVGYFQKDNRHEHTPQ